MEKGQWNGNPIPSAREPDARNRTYSLSERRFKPKMFGNIIIDIAERKQVAAEAKNWQPS